MADPLQPPPQQPVSYTSYPTAAEKMAQKKPVHLVATAKVKLSSWFLTYVRYVEFYGEGKNRKITCYSDDKVLCNLKIF